ncbi:unnamed protein product [Lupinus luteus]|uniref:Uncharacterized protein n=1 Tax=Lupinus luteus TaxID=3873 RepID=A0AAV1W0P5_LUPLU
MNTEEELQIGISVNEKRAPCGEEGSNCGWGSSRLSYEPQRNDLFNSRDSNCDFSPSRAAMKSSVGKERKKIGSFMEDEELKERKVVDLKEQWTILSSKYSLQFV